MNEWFVVYKYAPGVEGYAGICTWTSYPSKEEFEQVEQDPEYHSVVYAGPDANEAARICRESYCPIKHIRAQLHEAKKLAQDLIP